MLVVGTNPVNLSVFDHEHRQALALYLSTQAFLASLAVWTRSIHGIDDCAVTVGSRQVFECGPDSAFLKALGASHTNVNIFSLDPHFDLTGTITHGTASLALDLSSK